MHFFARKLARSEKKYYLCDQNNYLLMENDVIYEFFKEDESNVIWNVATIPNLKTGDFLFSFDKIKILSYLKDYPNNLTPGERAIFDSEFPYRAR